MVERILQNVYKVTYRAYAGGGAMWDPVEYSYHELGCYDTLEHAQEWALKYIHPREEYYTFKSVGQHSWVAESGDNMLTIVHSQTYDDVDYADWQELRRRKEQAKKEDEMARRRAMTPQDVVSYIDRNRVGMEQVIWAIDAIHGRQAILDILSAIDRGELP